LTVFAAATLKAASEMSGELKGFSALGGGAAGMARYRRVKGESEADREGDGRGGEGSPGDQRSVSLPGDGGVDESGGVPPRRRVVHSRCHHGHAGDG
jgi:hypothetical protein